VVFDLEIQKQIVDLKKATATEAALVPDLAVDGWGNAHTAGISSAVAYNVNEDRYYIYGDRPEEHIELVGQLTEADQVVGFNHIKFDYPLLAHATGVSLGILMGSGSQTEPGERDIDLLQMAWAGYGKRVYGSGFSLDAISLATLGARIGGKNGDGAHAPVLYQQGRWGELLNYNLRDVEITAKLLRFVQDHGYLITGKGVQIQTQHPAEWFK